MSEHDTPDTRPAPRAGAAPRVKIVDVAEAAGVHPSTVSRVLRAAPDRRVSPAVADRIRATADRLGYRPDAIAASLRTRSTRSIGVIVHDITDPVYPPILRGIESRLLDAGFMTVTGNTGYDPAAEAAMFEQMSSRMVDGVILGTTRLDDPVVARAAAAAIPLVSVLRRDAAGACSAVVNDCAAGMRALVDVIVAQGHRDIAAIAAPQGLSTARERLESLRASLAAHGCDLPEDRMAFVTRMDVAEGRRAALELLDRRTAAPGVIVAVNDLVAVGALQACRARGLSCPADISVTGYNDIPLVDMIDPPLTTVTMDLLEIGARSAELLLEQLVAPGIAPRIVRIAPALRVRGSLGPAPVRH
ncbi:LacI family DNA-binding transcriptional regulator [Roseivivax isoporae]|uniref:LacI family transcriptional regulator n=1 Tax=Roseivivax isoporae LMG 25204 TaxID=1449351 RepID=X7F8S8_9RHOB|nr:LacI family DNA-binding transcriptional regulator [Roseivivax isoporae]ETX28479.1 LacI family transcriptional regulator [Roseivivax isoporae LMG 25204]